MKKARRYARSPRFSLNLASQAGQQWCFSTLMLLTGLSSGSAALAEELKQSRVSQRSAAARQVTGPEENLQQAVALGATAIFQLVPAVSHPGGVYPHGGAYSEANISGSELTVFAGQGFHSFWEVYFSNWDPDYNPANGPESGVEWRTFIARVSSASFSSGDGGSLGYPEIACASAADCRNYFGIASGPVCDASLCQPTFVDRTRPDRFSQPQPTCFDTPIHDAGVDEEGPLFFGSAGPDVSGFQYCSIRDPHEPIHIGTLVLDIPADALGTYTLDFHEPETYATRDIFDVLIPILARIPGVLHVVPCTSDTDCDDHDECVLHTCNQGACEYTLLFDPETECCHAASGQAWSLPADLPCRVYSCGGVPGQVIGTNLPDGTPCESEDPCMENTVCSGLASCRGPQYVGPDCPKSRYITLDPPGSGGPSALRVTLLSLNRPQPDYDFGIPGGQFAAFEGEHRWVGPIGDCPNAAGQSAFKCAKLQCDPHYADWSSDLAGMPLHVTGAAVMPSSEYDVEQLAASCLGIEDECQSVTSLPSVATSRWARVWEPITIDNGEARPNVNDVAKVLDTLKGVTGSLHKSRVQLTGNDPNPHDLLSVIEIGHTVDAVKGFGYPFAGPSVCSP